MDNGEPNCHLLVVGKTGCGKSTICNRLLGSKIFPVYFGMTGSTMTVQREVLKGQQGRNDLTVLDTPDVFNMGLDGVTAEREVKSWMEHAPAKAVTLVLIRLDKRFTPTDRALYDRYLNSLPTCFKNVVVGFNRVEELPQDIDGEIRKNDLLKAFLRQARGRYVVFHSSDTVDRPLEQIMSWMEKCSPKAPWWHAGKSFMKTNRLLLLVLFSVGLFGFMFRPVVKYLLCLTIPPFMNIPDLLGFFSLNDESEWPSL